MKNITLEVNANLKIDFFIYWRDLLLNIILYMELSMLLDSFGANQLANCLLMS